MLNANAVPRHPCTIHTHLEHHPNATQRSLTDIVNAGIPQIFQGNQKKLLNSQPFLEHFFKITENVTLTDRGGLCRVISRANI